jgi:alkylation response protein AidB-like acyl-CoA dehydrogenase
MRVPQSVGGAGIDATGYALALEGLSEGDSPFGAMVASSNLVASILFDYGSAEQHERWLRPYAEGKLGPGGYGLTEPEAGSDVAGMRTTARPVDGGYELNGSKMWITNGSEAKIFLVFARTDPADRRRGVSCFVVERGTPGFQVGKDEPKMGLRCSGTTALHFEDCRVDASHRLGEQGQGMAIALGALTPGRVGIAAQCVGIAEAAYREGLTYAAEREVFGKRLTEFQNTQFLLADARIDVDLAWLAVLRAAALLDAGQAARMECRAALS